MFDCELQQFGGVQRVNSVCLTVNCSSSVVFNVLTVCVFDCELQQFGGVQRVNSVCV